MGNRTSNQARVAAYESSECQTLKTFYQGRRVFDILLTKGRLDSAVLSNILQDEVFGPTKKRRSKVPRCSIAKAREMFSLRNLCIQDCVLAGSDDGVIKELVGLIKDSSALEGFEFSPSDNWCEEDIASLLVAVAESITTLRRFVFCPKHKKTAAQGSKLGQLLKSNMHLEEVRLSVRGDSQVLLHGAFQGLNCHHSNLRTLGLPRCDMGDQELLSLLPVLQALPNLATLDLSRNRLTPQSLSSLACLLGNGSSLKTLDLGNQATLFFEYRQEQVVSFVNSVSSSRTLESLCLRSCSVDDTVACLFMSQVLTENARLIRLDLSFNKLTAMTMRCLQKEIPRFTAVRELGLYGVSFDRRWNGKERSALLRAVERNAHIRAFALDDQIFHQGDRRTLAKILERNSLVQTVTQLFQQSAPPPPSLWPVYIHHLVGKQRGVEFEAIGRDAVHAILQNLCWT